MLLAQRWRFGRIVKPVWMFDSFQGLSPADERDGPMAFEYEANAFAPGNHDNCIAPLDGICAAIASFGFADEDIRIVPGWFNDTIPSQISDLTTEGIALLRIDCDWYEPVHRVLVHLAPLVNDECPIILDDYYAWDGCARATHDYLYYLSQNDLSWRIRSMDRFDGAWMIKRARFRCSKSTSRAFGGFGLKLSSRLDLDDNSEPREEILACHLEGQDISSLRLDVADMSSAIAARDRA